MIKLKSYSGQSSQGPYLMANEDGYDFDVANNLLCFFDGFGGAGVGDRAVKDLTENIKKFYFKFAQDPDSTLPFAFNQRLLLEGNALLNSAFYAHKELCLANSKLAMGKRAGASGILACWMENIISLVSVGNCSCLLVRDGKIKKIFLEDDFSLLSSDSSKKEFRSFPTTGFGLFPDLSPQLKELRIFENDLLVFFTDGASNRLDNDEMKSILTSHKLENDQKISRIFQLSNDRGNLDNQSIFILNF